MHFLESVVINSSIQLWILGRPGMTQLLGNWKQRLLNNSFQTYNQRSWYHFRPSNRSDMNRRMFWHSSRRSDSSLKISQITRMLPNLQNSLSNFFENKMNCKNGSRKNYLLLQRLVHLRSPLILLRQKKKTEYENTPIVNTSEKVQVTSLPELSNSKISTEHQDSQNNKVECYW